MTLSLYNYVKIDRIYPLTKTAYAKFPLMFKQCTMNYNYFGTTKP